MGMFPTLKQLFSLGVKPGSGVSLMPFMRAKDREITARIAQRFAGRTLNRTVPGVRNPLSLGYAKTVLAPVNPMTSGFASTMLASNPYATKLPRRLYPDLSDILKVQAAAAGRYRKFAAVDDKPSLPPHHFRNLLFALGPATGAISGGLEPLVGTFNERIWEGFSHDVPKFPGLFKNYPWKKVLPGAGVGAVKGALGGLLVGAILDKYLQKKLHPRGLLAS